MYPGQAYKKDNRQQQGYPAQYSQNLPFSSAQVPLQQPQHPPQPPQQPYYPPAPGYGAPPPQGPPYYPPAPFNQYGPPPPNPYAAPPLNPYAAPPPNPYPAQPPNQYAAPPPNQYAAPPPNPYPAQPPNQYARQQTMQQPGQPYQLQHAGTSMYQYDPNFQVSQCTGRRRALLIGINYFGQKGQLKGCVNDVKNIKKFLIQYFGYRAEDMVVLTDDQKDPNMIPTRQNIIRGMHWLVNGSHMNDSFFFHYSGHGGQVEDKDGDESDGYDETILPVDYEKAGEIVDDEMHAIMVKGLPQGVRLTAIFDSCHSGTALDLPYVYASDGSLQKKTATKYLGQAAKTAGTQYVSGNLVGAIKALASGVKSSMNAGQAQELQRSTRTTWADVIMFSGCKDAQTSADTHVQGLGSTGAMSFAFIAAMEENPRRSYIDLLRRMREILKDRYTQKPQMSTGRPMDMNSIFIM